MAAIQVEQNCSAHVHKEEGKRKGPESHSFLRVAFPSDLSTSSKALTFQIPPSPSSSTLGTKFYSDLEKTGDANHGKADWTPSGGSCDIHHSKKAFLVSGLTGHSMRPFFSRLATR